MDVTKIPFNEFIGIGNSDRDDSLLMLGDNAKYANHIGTVHASALFALAEATSGMFLLGELPGREDSVVAVVRKVETGYKKPAYSKVYSSACFRDTTPEEVRKALEEKHRTLAKVQVTISDSEDVAVMVSIFEWFITSRR